MTLYHENAFSPRFSLEEEIQMLKQECDGYRGDVARLHEERDQLIAFSARLAQLLGMPSGITRDTSMPIAEFEHVVVISLPAGQVSWHIPSSHLQHFLRLPRFYGELEQTNPIDQKRRLQYISPMPWDVDEIYPDTYQEQEETPFSGEFYETSTELVSVVPTPTDVAVYPTPTASVPAPVPAPVPTPVVTTPPADFTIRPSFSLPSHPTGSLPSLFPLLPYLDKYATTLLPEVRSTDSLPSVAV